MLRVRFLRNFILNTVLTTLNEDGIYSIQEFSYHVSENIYVNDITGYSEHSIDTLDVDFNGAGGIQGSAIGVLKNHIEIHNTNGPSSPPPPPKPCCP